MDLSRLVARKSANSKNGMQDFDLKFRRPKEGVRSHFEFSDLMFNKLELEDNGFIPMVHPDDKTIVILRIVPNDEAVWFKPVGGKKTKSRQSSVLESDLIKAGIIDDSSIGNFHLKLDEVEDGYYQIINDEENPNDIQGSLEDDPSNEETEQDPEAEEMPQEEPAGKRRNFY